MKCKLCGYTIDGDKCPGCDNELTYLKKHRYIINEEEKPKEQLSFKAILFLPFILILLVILAYIFWINKSIPVITNRAINNVISNMKDNIDYLNVTKDDNYLYISNNSDTYDVDSNNYIYYFDNDNYLKITSIEGMESFIKIANYLFNEGKLKDVFESIKDDLTLTKYKVSYDTVFHNEHNMISLKTTYNVNNVYSLINKIKDNYINDMSIIWGIDNDDTLTKLDTYNKGIKLNIYTDILALHVYKIDIDMGDILELDILNNKIVNIKYVSDGKTVILKDNEIKVSTNDTLENYKYDYNKKNYENDLTY